MSGRRRSARGGAGLGEKDELAAVNVAIEPFDMVTATVVPSLDTAGSLAPAVTRTVAAFPIVTETPSPLANAIVCPLRDTETAVRAPPGPVSGVGAVGWVKGAL